MVFTIYINCFSYYHYYLLNLIDFRCWNWKNWFSPIIWAFSQWCQKERMVKWLVSKVHSVPCPLKLKSNLTKLKIVFFFSGSCPEITAKVTKILSQKEYFKRLALMIPLWFAVGLGWVFQTFNYQSFQSWIK